MKHVIGYLKPLRVAAVCVITMGGVAHAADSSDAAAIGGNYTIVDLGTLGPSGESAAFSISDTRTIAGTVVLDAVYWQGTTLYDLGAPPSGSGGEARGVNNLGQLAGDYFFFATFTSLPFWVPSAGGTPQILPTLTVPDARASAINDWGLIAGTGQLDSNDPNDNLGGQRAVVWFRGAIRDLGTLGGPSAIADTEGNVNDVGTVVGASDINTTVNPAFGGYTFHATMWTDTTTRHPVAHDLGSLAHQKDDQVSFATSINNFGQVVGWSLTDIPDRCFSGTQQWGFVWQDGQMRGLPPLAGDCDAQANIGNVFGTIVGNSMSVAADGSPVTRAVLWRNGNAVDLTTLLRPGSGWTLTFASGINDFGEIVGTGINPQGIRRAFLMRR
jgi:probable HAF family extracellular repeat protein